MESFATGLKHLKELCDEVGCKVEFYGDSYGFTVRFYRHCGEGWANYENTSNDRGSTNTETSIETSIETSTETITKSSRDIIIHLLQNNPRMTINKLANTTGLSRSGVRHHIDSLKREGILYHDGSTKSGKWIIKGKQANHWY